MTEKFTPYPWKNKSESATTPLDRQELNKSEEEQGKYSEKGLIKSEEAAAKSVVAEGTATAAKAEAKVAKEKAEAAETEAKAAKTEAITAKSEISGTKAEAKLAKEKSESAEATAKTAKEEAKTATTTAESAKAQAEAAVIIAESAGSSASAGNPGSFKGTIKSPYKIIEKVTNLPTAVAVTGAELSSSLLKPKTKIAKTPTEVKAGEWTIELEAKQEQLTKESKGFFEVRAKATKRPIVEVPSGSAVVSDNTNQETTRIQITNEIVDFNHFYNISGERKGVTASEASEGVDAAPVIQEALYKAETGFETGAVACGEPGIYQLGSVRVNKNSSAYKKLKTPYSSATFKACLHKPSGVTLGHSRNVKVMNLIVTAKLQEEVEAEVLAEPTGPRPVSIAVEGGDDRQTPTLGYFKLSTEGTATPGKVNMTCYTMPPVIDGIFLGSQGVYRGTQIKGNFRYNVIPSNNHMQWHSLLLEGGWFKIGQTTWANSKGATGNLEVHSCNFEGGFGKVYCDDGSSFNSVHYYGGYFNFGMAGPTYYKPTGKKNSRFLAGLHFTQCQFEGGESFFAYNPAQDSTIANLTFRDCQAYEPDSQMAIVHPENIEALPQGFIVCGSIEGLDVQGPFLPQAGWGHEAAAIVAPLKAHKNNLGDLSQVIHACAGRGIPIIRSQVQEENTGENNANNSNKLPQAIVSLPIANTEIREGQVLQDAAPLQPKLGISATESYKGGLFSGIALSSSKKGFPAATARPNQENPVPFSCKIMRLGKGEGQGGVLPEAPRGKTTKLTATLENGKGGEFTSTTTITEAVKPSTEPTSVKVASTTGLPETGKIKLGTGAGKVNIASYSKKDSTHFLGLEWTTLEGTEEFSSSHALETSLEHTLPTTLYQSSAYDGAIYLNTLADLASSGFVSSVPNRVISYRQKIEKATKTSFKVKLTNKSNEAKIAGGSPSITGISPRMVVKVVGGVGEAIPKGTEIETVDGTNKILWLSQSAKKSEEREFEVIAPCDILEGTLFNDSTRVTEKFKANTVTTIKVESTVGWPSSGTINVGYIFGEKALEYKYSSITGSGKELVISSTPSNGLEIPAGTVVARFGEGPLPCRSRIYQTAQVGAVTEKGTTYTGSEQKISTSTTELAVASGAALPASGRALVYAQTTLSEAQELIPGTGTPQKLKVISTASFPAEGELKIGNTTNYFEYTSKAENGKEFIGEMGSIPKGRRPRPAGDIITPRYPVEVYYGKIVSNVLKEVQRVGKTALESTNTGALVIPTLVSAEGGVFSFGAGEGRALYPYAGYVNTLEKFFLTGVVTSGGGGTVSSGETITDESGISVEGSNFPTEKGSFSLKNSIGQEATAVYEFFLSGNIEVEEGVEPAEEEEGEEVEGSEGTQLKVIPGGFFVGVTKVEKSTEGVTPSGVYVGGTTLTKAFKPAKKPATIEVSSTAGFPSKGILKVSTELSEKNVATYTGVTATEFTGLTWTEFAGGEPEAKVGAAVVPYQGQFIKAGEIVRAAYGASGRSGTGDVGVVYAGSEGPVVGVALENDEGGSVNVLFS